jgi:NAD(P)-dependent dehydrogenase (short-subunit alcohol dehydrogenase family)
MRPVNHRDHHDVRTHAAACGRPVLMAPQNYFLGKSVLITGASSGIGRTLALQLGAAGAQLTLAARRGDLLATVADEVAAAGAARPVVSICDVAREGEVEQAVGAAVQAYSKLDVVFANAGFGVVGFFERLTLDDYRRQFETNVFGVLRTLKASQSQLVQHRGNAVVIGSVAGYCATPGNSPYCMSKFALRALASAITPEFAQAGVRVTLISPGFVGSNIRKVDNAGHFHPDAAEPIPAWLIYDTEKACRRILRAVAAGRTESIITGHGKLLVAIARFAPWILQLAGRRMAASGRGHRPEANGRTS